MSESTNEGNFNLDVVKVLITPPETRELEAAKVIIQDIIRTSEKTISPSSDLGNISGHSSVEIRNALAVTTRKIMSMPGSRFRSRDLGAVETFKQTQYGEACLWLGSRIDPHSDNPIPELSNITLELNSAELEAVIPLHDTSVRLFALFRDWRKHVHIITPQSPEEKFDLSTFRSLWRGMRWLSANLDIWETSGFIMPEDLPKQSAKALPEPLLQLP